MAKTSKINIILSAVDKMTFVIDKAINNGVSKLNSFQKKSDQLSRSSANFARSTGAMGVAAGAALAVPLKVAADFEQAMANTGAITRANKKDMDLLTESARLMGRTTQFTAMEAAEAQRFLGMAGFKTNQIISALPKTLELAAAGAIDLGSAADISSNILSGFSLKAEDLGRVNDILVNTFTQSNTTLKSLGETMKFVAPVAKSLKIPIEQVAAMAGKLGDAGIQGSMAGTAMRAVMLRLASPTGEAKKAIQSLSIATSDSAGNLRPIMQILDDVNAAMAGMGTAKKADIISTIFGKEPSAAVTQLLSQVGSGDLQKFAQDVTKSGSASQVAARQMATAQGSMKLFNSAVQDLLITVGNALLPTFTRLAKKLNNIVAKISAFATKNPKLVKTIAMVTAGFASLMLVFSGAGFIISGIATFFSTMATLGPIVLSGLKMIALGVRAIGAAMIANPILAIIAAIAVAAYLIYDNWGPISAWFINLWDKIKATFQTFLNWWDGISLFDAGANVMNSLWEGLKSQANKVINFASELGNDISSSFKSVLGIASPSKVFIQHGQDIAKGAEVGMMAGNAGNAMGATAGALVANSPSPVSNSVGGSVVLNYSPNINLAGASESQQQDFAQILKENAQEIVRLVQDIQQRNKSLSF